MRPRLTVDLASETGPVFHGATGALYGLSEDGVPSADLLAPLHVRSIAQKPPGGLQHPTGDADRVAPGFFRAGGERILVYLQDIYPDWPYKDNGIADYLTRVKSIVSYVTDQPYHHQIAFVPFNEPDWIWYDLKTTDRAQYLANRDRFLADWTAACQMIRSLSPDALIVGPNEAYYDSRFMPDFLSYAKAGDVLPDIISWHELRPSSLRTYRSSYASFRELEKRLGIPPLPIDVNEYGNRRDLSNPGQLVQWIAMFEDTKVYADQAYWDIAGNYADNAVQNTMPNGSWWLMRWYGAMTGNTVRVTRTMDTIDTLCGLASLDTGKRQARVIVANPAGDKARIAVTGIDRHVFGERVRVLTQSTTWTGYDGVASTPLELAEADYPVVNGQVRLDLDAMDPMTAYQLTMSPATRTPPPVRTPPWIAQYHAAAAARTDCTVHQQGSAANPDGYAAAGGADVGSIDQPGSRVKFQVTVPHTGRYLLSVYYGNQTQDIAQQILRVDDQPWSFMNYPPTLNGAFRSHQDRHLDLTAGSHAITFGVADPAIGTTRGQVTLNIIKLAYTPAAIPGVTHPAAHYPAAYADLSGGATVDYGGHLGARSASGYVMTPAGSGVAFVVQTDHDGYYDLRLRYATEAPAPAAGFTLLVGGADLKVSAITGSSGRTFDRVYLHAGINRIEYRPEGAGSVAIDSLDVTPDAAADAAAAAVTYAAAAPRNVRSGTAVVLNNPYAYGGQCVGGIGHGGANTLTFTGVTAPRAGTYRVIVSYANNDRAQSDNYNANLIDRGFTVSTSAGTRLTMYARNTYSWNQFNTIGLTVQLAAGENTIVFGHPVGDAPTIDKIIVAPASLPERRKGVKGQSQRDVRRAAGANRRLDPPVSRACDGYGLPR